MLFNQYGYSLDSTIPYLYYSSTFDTTVEELKQVTNEINFKNDIEKLLNIYIDNRNMTKEEYEYFSNKYQDIINKRNALNILKNRIKGDRE